MWGLQRARAPSQPLGLAEVCQSSRGAQSASLHALGVRLMTQRTYDNISDLKDQTGVVRALLPRHAKHLGSWVECEKQTRRAQAPLKPLGQLVAAAAEAAPFTMLAPLMMTLCLTLTNGMVHHAALLRPGPRPAPTTPRMFDLGQSTGGVKGRSNQAGGSNKIAVSVDSPAVSQVPYPSVVSAPMRSTHLLLTLMVQVQRLRDLPGNPVAALKYLSSSVTYRGSRGNLAEARSEYVRYPRLVDDTLRVIYDKEKLYRSAKTGLWTYPGWRVDMSKALRSNSKRSLEEASGQLDRNQELDDALAHGVLSGLGTSLKSCVLNISAVTWLVIISAALLLPISMSGALLICALANTYVY